ncbi:MAG: prolyl oligopeptidase family serine peptidase [Verrucomicrobia bacterium]|nr:prolyl oligopeptidase family serine peptidase [Verrucomicrobiota bacterium]
MKEGRREAFATDGMLHLIARDGFAGPQAGDRVPHESGKEASWRSAVYKDGELILPKTDDDATEQAESPQGRQRRGGGADYIYLTATSEAEEVLLLNAKGQSAVMVNGEWRNGDAYGNNSLPIPVLVKKGLNHFLFAASSRAGAFSASLKKAEQPVFFHDGDVTLPDWVHGDSDAEAWLAAIVVNASTEWLSDIEIRTGLQQEQVTPCGAIPPLGFRKLGFRVESVGVVNQTVPITATLQRSGKGEQLAMKTMAGTLRSPNATRSVTFISDIDGSVQYYGLVPATPKDGDPVPGIVLSLHGASVEGIGQARSYQNKDWTHIVAPTNRRPFGFDWEDWGRIDAMEVFEHAKAQLQPDPQRQYLTGHSMGGHGTWQLGAHFPDQFAAIGPSAGWISFWSYAGAMNRDEPTAIEKIFLRAASPSDTLALSRNYLHEGIYILHGDADDNVPVSEARTMREHLATFHPNFTYFEQPGAGHWWGNRCVDWPRMFEFFKHHELPLSEDVTKVQFKTASPAVSSHCHWATIEAQTAPLEASGIDIAFDSAKRRFAGTTENVSRLSIDIAHVPTGDPLTVEIDGQAIEHVASPAGTHHVWLSKVDSKWSITGVPAANEKRPERMGPFKEAFRNRVVFVYGTTGDAGQNSWALAKARFDAETFWYRGNGSIDIVADADFDAEKFKDRSVILFGNSATNGAWKTLLADCPINVTNGTVQFGDEKIEGDDLTALFVYPRPDSSRASVGVVAGTGMAGFRASDRLPYFVSGVAYPDFTIMKSETLLKRRAGVVKAGFFTNQWQLPK